MRNWCRAVGLTYGQTLGIGAGEMLAFIKDVPLGHGPNKNIGTALQKLSQNILSRSQGEDLFISPNWPRFLWKIQASLFFWYPRAKKNGLKRRDTSAASETSWGRSILKQSGGAAINGQNKTLASLHASPPGFCITCPCYGGACSWYFSSNHFYLCQRAKSNLGKCD